MHKNITIVAACVDFDDYLNIVAQSWIQLKPKEIIIVTTDDDHKTIRLCNKYGLTAKTVKRPKRWIRGYYINSGLKDVKTCWSLVLDSDCWLPNLTINTNKLHKRYLYGLKLAQMSAEQLENYTIGNYYPNRIRTRVTGSGFFQLFCARTQRKYDRWYNEECNVLPNGKGTSYNFSRKWRRRKLLSNDFAIEISSNHNRQGRKTMRYPNDVVFTKGKLIQNKTSRFKKLINNRNGTIIHEI